MIGRLNLRTNSFTSIGGDHVQEPMIAASMRDFERMLMSRSISEKLRTP
jgi:hypothetical protein